MNWRPVHSCHGAWSQEPSRGGGLVGRSSEAGENDPLWRADSTTETLRRSARNQVRVRSARADDPSQGRRIPWSERLTCSSQKPTDGLIRRRKTVGYYRRDFLWVSSEHSQEFERHCSEHTWPSNNCVGLLVDTPCLLHYSPANAFSLGVS